MATPLTLRCPTPLDLAAYFEAELPLTAHEAIERHARACDHCGAVLLKMGRACSANAMPALARSELPAAGEVIGRYIVIAPRAAGAMGVVLEAYDPQLGREVALKLVRPDVERRGGEKARARLLREAELMGRVRHPHVVEVYDAGVVGDRVFVAMQLIEGVTLREWLEAPREPAEILRVFRQAGRGLAAAHAAGVVHRDFKPDNVLVDARGQAFVTDFGLAWSPDLVGSPQGLHGTAQYMAPEQIAAARVDARSDQFSFCVALLEALVGVRPFKGLHRPADFPIDARLAPRLAAALRRGLALDPDARFPELGALLAALRAPPPPRPWVALAAVAAALVGAVLVG